MDGHGARIRRPNSSAQRAPPDIRMTSKGARLARDLEVRAQGALLGVGGRFAADRPTGLVARKARSYANYLFE